MPLSYDELVQERTFEQCLAQMQRRLLGVGFISMEGRGTGRMELHGVPSGMQVGEQAAVLVEVTTAGTRGTARLRYSINGGDSWYAENVLVPGSGLVALATTGITMAFYPGPVGQGTSFEVGDTYKARLNNQPFPVTSWGPSGAAQRLIEKFSEVFEHFATVQKQIGRSGIMRLAVGMGPWADITAEELYNLKRKPGTVARHRLLFTDTAGEGPFPLEAGDVWMVADNGLRFVNDAAGTIPKGGTLTLTFSAEAQGAAYNVAVDSISTFVNVLPGVTATNPDLGTGSSIIRQGSDPESDAELYERCRQRWPSLGFSPTQDVYALWAKSVSDEVTRVAVYPSLTVPGEVELYLAGPSGGVSDEAVATVDDFIQPIVALTNTALVQKAINHVITVTGTLHIQSAFLGTAPGEAQTECNSYLQSVPISGKVFDTGGIAEALTRPAGVVDLDLTSTGDVQLARGEVAVPGPYNLTVVEYTG